MKIIWSPLALDRLTEISDFISLDKPNAAIEWINSIFNSVENLKSFPESGRKVPELENIKYRELIIGNYRVIYKITESQIQILTVRRCSQLLTHGDLS